MLRSFYRKISNQSEVNQILGERKVQSNNPATHYVTCYTPSRYDDIEQAEEELALPTASTRRTGSVLGAQMPAFDIALRTVAPAFGKPGGGFEVRTTSPVLILGLWNFMSSDWDM